jgi:hypothetical protein
VPAWRDICSPAATGRIARLRRGMTDLLYYFFFGLFFFFSFLFYFCILLLDAARDIPRISHDRDIPGNPRDFEKHQDLQKVLGF